MTDVYSGAWHEADVCDPAGNHTGRVRARFSLRQESTLPEHMRGTPELIGEAELIEGRLPETEWFTLTIGDKYERNFFAEQIARDRYRLFPSG